MRILCLIAIAIAIAAIDFQNPPPAEHPVMNLPLKGRQSNWARYGEGSCVVASTISCLRWQGRHADAERLKRAYGGGQDYDGWNEALDKTGIRYACTYRKNDVAFLERCIATRRGCIVGVNPYKNSLSPAHMVCLVDMTASQCAILDNNDVTHYLWVSRSEFLAEWKRAGSWALTPIYTPTSPRIP